MLKANNIHKVYCNGNKSISILRGVDLSIDKGKFIAIVGPSGAGKSTLLHILGGLDSPTKGEVIFGGKSLYNLSDAVLSNIRNKDLGFVFQFYHLLAEFTVLENVLMPALISRQPSAVSRQLRDEAGRLLQEVGLGERKDHFPNQLSGGERQRVALARALINRPQLLLCDEPTGNLDSKTGSEIVALIKKINSENQMAVILVTHNVELVKAADNIYYLRDGVLAS
ncbi:MAG: ABC transporter ATP-binding protein [Candidatus Omnitrophica bacterium]|jgi:lipoprotein-releasing system ATP-binding protein|nr:ABC transporter ATP-binding protein [Candidatus Omnitrophota bacterium]